MPNAFDRRQPPNDHDPLAGLLDYNEIDTGAQHAGGLIGGLFANITQGITDLATSIANAVGGGVAVVTGIFGPAIQGIFDTVFGLWGSVTTAQSTGDAALAETALIKATLEGVISGGSAFIEDFEGAQATTLAGYTQLDIVSGTGTYGRKDGYGHWFTAFSVSQTILNIRNTDILNTSTQRIAIKLKTKVLHPERAIWLVVRPDASGDDAMFVKINPTNFQYGYMLGGAAPVYLDTITGGANTDGQLWQLEVGAAGQPAGTNDWLWTVKRSSGETFTVVDDPTSATPPGGGTRTAVPGAAVFLDSSHRSLAFAASARNEFGAQVAPPDIEVITWADI
jgi:hypothetical protein